MTRNVYKNYLYDLGIILREEAIKIKKESKDTSDDFVKGKLMAYYEIISLLKQQAKAFGIDLSDLNLSNFDEYKELLTP
jgi:hypothetical protein